VSSSSALSQPLVIEFGGVNPVAWLRKPPKADEDFVQLLEFKKKLDAIGGKATGHFGRGEYSESQKKYKQLLDLTK